MPRGPTLLFFTLAALLAASAPCFLMGARILLGAPVPGFPSRIELAHLDVRSAHSERPPLIAQGENGHLPQSSSASRFTASHAGFFICRAMLSLRSPCFMT